ncbi:DUF4352 domain-containing protein [Bacillus cereus group sp. RP43]|uniref:DUF4352 domain-containing protein n=1 Tax=Bacillus cereus group sp. RP43 TaxID=3040260 RepID=UPI0033921E7D
MKQLTKKMISTVCMTSILFSAGCTGAKDIKKESLEQQEVKSEIGKEKVSQEMEMKIKVTGAKIIEDKTVSEQEQVVQVQFEIKNEGKDDNGIGAGDFVIQDDKGKTYPMYGKEDNFGDVIPVGKSLKGNGYYNIAKGTKELKVVYKPTVKQEMDEKTIEWKIGNLKK